MELIFENSAGKMKFFGSGRGTYRLIEIAGLSSLKKETDTVRYPFFDGTSVLDIYMPPRTVTAAFDVVSCRVGRDVENAARILSGEAGILTVQSGFKKRVTDAVCTSFNEEKRYGKSISRCTVQFMCPDPYFYDGMITYVPLFKRNNLLKSVFTMPCVFTERVHSIAVHNEGIFNVYPIYRIYGKSISATGEEGVLIMNHTTGKSLTLSHVPKDNEVIEIDIKNATVTSTVSGNILHCVSDECAVTDMYLAPGENNITADPIGDMQNLSVICEYRNKYAEAVC